MIGLPPNIASGLPGNLVGHQLAVGDLLQAARIAGMIAINFIMQILKECVQFNGAKIIKKIK